MKKDIEKYPEIKFLTMPKWATPVALFVAVAMIGFSVYQNREKLAFGKLFPFLGAGAQTTTDTSEYPNPNKFGVNAAVQTYVLSDEVVQNAAALSGPGATIVGIIQGTDDGWVGTTAGFILSAKKYCLTPILRVDVRVLPDSPELWGEFFRKVMASAAGYDSSKLVISLGNEVNFKFEWPKGWEGGKPGLEYAKYLRDAISAIRPNVGSAKIIGAPLNTSAPAPGNAEYIYWETFVDQMNEAGGWKDAVDGHASNPYPVGGLSVYLYQTEMNKFGYIKPVYILETGNNSGVGTASPGAFMDSYWGAYCSDGSIAAVNFFNATGANADPRWTEDNKFVFKCGELEGRNLDCPVASPEIRYSDYSQCEIVPRSKYKAGVGADEAFSGCVTNQLTTLLPEEVNYSVKTENGLLLKNGYGKAIGRMDIEDVSVTNFIQSSKVENTTNLPIISQLAEFQTVLKYQVNYDVKSYYPADGRFDSSVGVAVESWLNESCKNGNEHNQRASGMGIPSDLWPYQEINTSWQCGDGEGFTFTQYAEYRDPPVQKASYVYFPLGSALGATYLNPYIYFGWFTPADDFVVANGEGSSIPPFVGGQSPGIEYNLTIMDKLKPFLQALYGALLEKIGVNTEVSSHVKGVDLTTSSGLKVTGYYDDQYTPGESGVDIGEFEYNQDCGALDDLVIEYNNHVIPGLESRVGCSLPPTCFDSFGNFLYSPECTNTYCTANADVQKLVNQAKGARDTVARLAAQCKGTDEKDLTGLKMDGQLSLSAPFVPILASERLEDVLWSRQTVCTDAEDNLYAAKVKANVKWYDVNRMESDKVLGCPDNNLLLNGDMELSSGMPILQYRTGSEAGSGPVVASGVRPANWDVAWKKDYQQGVDGDFQSDACGNGSSYEFCKAPEFKPAFQTPDPRRVLTGQQSSMWFSSFNTHDVLMFQSATVNGTVTASAYAQMWRASDETKNDEGTGCVKSDPDGSFVELCVIESSKISNFPADREIPMAQYDELINKLHNEGSCTKANNFDTWNALSVTVTAHGSVTVFLRGNALFALRNTDDYFDNVCLVPKGGLTDINEAISTWEPKRDSGGKCSLYNASTNNCAKSLAATNFNPDALILEEKVEFYAPGVGAIPSMRERVSVGIAKSPDNTGDGKAKGGGLYSGIDMHYCADRTDSEASAFHKYNKEFSTLDIYIIQNLQPTSLARQWAKAIAPNVSDADIDEILAGSGDYCSVGGGSSSGGGTSGGGTPANRENYDREPTTNESLIIAECEKNRYTKEQCAYTLATAMFESSVVPIGEYGCCDKNGGADSLCPKLGADEDCGCVNENQKKYGSCDFVTGQCYYGRGFVQLTHKYNYQRVGNNIGVDLVNYPEKALEPAIATKVIIDYFNGRGIKTNIQSTDDFVQARRMVNGDTDHLCTRSDCDKTKTVGENVAGIALSYFNGTVMGNYVEY